MRRPVTALLAPLLLGAALALGACGDDQEFTDVVPRTTPDLRAPANAALPSAQRSGQGTSTTSTTETTTTETTPGAATGGTSAAPSTATPAPAAPSTGGTAAGGTSGGTGGTTGGTGGTGGTTGGGTTQGDSQDSGGFSDFCQQNPGACPG